MTMQQHLPKWLAVVGLALAANMSALAQTKEVTFAHQDMLVPLRTIMESGELEKATGYKINWRMFGGGGDVIRGLAGSLGAVMAADAVGGTAEGAVIRFSPGPVAGRLMAALAAGRRGQMVIGLAGRGRAVVATGASGGHRHIGVELGR